MGEQRRHDSIAPKGAFAAKDADDTELAAALTATLIATEAAAATDVASNAHADGTSSDDTNDANRDDDTEISIFRFDHAAAMPDDLCADEMIPVGATENPGRVSVEDAMRALIELRLERSRPSDDFGAFELGDAVDGTPQNTQAIAAPQSVDESAMHSLAPIELTRVKTTSTTSHDARKFTPMPVLAAAAIILLGVGIYRRANREPAVQAPVALAAAQLHAAPTSSPPTTIADAPTAQHVDHVDVAAPEMQVLGVSESDYATLTLGTPTIVYIPDAIDDAKPSAHRSARAAKQSGVKQDSAAAITPKLDATPFAEVAVATDVAVVAEVAAPQATALPDAPSRDAILAGFNSVRAEVLACAHGNGGVAPIEATIVGDGQVTHATVGGYYQGTPEGSCIARALRSARFTPFARESIKVAFPFTL